MVFRECPCIWFGRANSSLFLALEKYSNAVKHVLIFIFIIWVGEMGQVEKSLIVFKFPRVKETQVLTDPPERLHFIVFSRNPFKNSATTKTGHRGLKKKQNFCFFIIVKYIQKRTNPEQQQQTTVSSYKHIP